MKKGRRKDRQKDQKKKSHIPFRLNLLFLIVFFSFIAVIARLAYVQVVKGSDFEALVRRTETSTITKPVPRGSIYDSKGKIVVGNEAKMAITFTRPAAMTTQEMLEVARELAGYIQMDTSQLKERDLKDYWYVTNPEKAKQLLSAEESKKSTSQQLSNAEVYEMELAHINSEDISYSDSEKEVIAIFSIMNSAYSLSSVSIKNEDVTDEEVARVSERLGKLKGIDVTSDWNRVYPMGDMLASILGTVSSEKTGLPSSKVNSYRTQGYSLNERVGISYLEEQYESVLRGTKSVIQNTKNTDGTVTVGKEVYGGKSGSNIVLTIDTKFQQRLEDIAVNTLLNQNDPYTDRAYIVVMNPNNGDIIGITGKKKKYNENGEYESLEDDALGAINSSYSMGSAIKAATVLSGYMDGVISLDNNVIVDEPIVFEGSEPKTSFFNKTDQIPIDDLRALEQSSNVYMIKLAMRMGGQYDYAPNGRLNIDPGIFDKLRNYYAQFGLGVKTGIDLPSESTGYNGGVAATYSALDFAYGQFDLYTPLQLAQYMATIANNGTRMAPRLVKEIHSTGLDGGLGALDVTVRPKVMNSIQTTQEILKHVQSGLYRVTHGTYGTATRSFGGYGIEVAGKSGTAEAFYSGSIQQYQRMSVLNHTFVAYAPYDHPEIVVSVVLPYFDPNTSPSISADKVARDVMDAYFYGTGVNSSSTATETSRQNAHQ